MIEDIIAEKSAMDRFAEQLDELMAELGYDAAEARAEADAIVGVTIL